MNRITWSVILGAAASVAAWLIYERRENRARNEQIVLPIRFVGTEEAAQGGTPSSAIDPKMVRQPANPDPKMVRQPANPDPKMVIDSSRNGTHDPKAPRSTPEPL